MSYNIRFPNIPDGPVEVQLQHIKSAMYQLVEQLNWILSNIETGNQSGQNQSGKQT